MGGGKGSRCYFIQEFTFKNLYAVYHSWFLIGVCFEIEYITMIEFVVNDHSHEINLLIIDGNKKAGQDLCR